MFTGLYPISYGLLASTDLARLLGRVCCILNCMIVHVVRTNLGLLRQIMYMFLFVLCWYALFLAILYSLSSRL